MTKGVQREVAKEKTGKKQKTGKKPKDELPVEQKKAKDVVALQTKQNKTEVPSSQPVKEVKTATKKAAKAKATKL
ncbi:hypothetical protein D910_01614 [Dendroctonus ponderosae]|uniref:Uncharacterized protein n=1 Tax=Dendroctonus ponderosae TaxID=77166 RepID=U4U2K7_DENPD|nr:hypothetical protein D910_01589 [Dendroctonus ponderosae]ERL84235.1 hypothetical protein D910_01614 [Dendroctonus ponderosae]KAH0999680.1 hypothetical protein HUJ05_005172 [Dendroctonus ponderosae]KAH1001366.1 hypothetical protein HUJ05_013385 [Dendroctonus ponderosae]KAH1005815.1 hypothetical protein HUJ04_006730 [Dendroctonus ponderosae]